jgi:hypothetical protein
MAFILGLFVYLLSIPVLLLSFAIIILLEAILLRRLFPGINAFRDSVIMNITTYVLGAIFTFVFYDPLDSFLYDLSEWGMFESGTLKLLETKMPFPQILRAATIINLASQAMLGITIGLFLWGYELADYYENAGFILLCGLPIALIALIIRLMKENSAATSSKGKNEGIENRLPHKGNAEETTMDPEQIHSSVPNRQQENPFKLFSIWILVTAIGTTFGFGVSGAVINKLESVGGITWSVLILSVGIGGMQWLFLHRHIKNAGGWVVATLGGWTFALALATRASVLLAFTPDELVAEGNLLVIALGILVVSLILGIVTGISQWLVLRKQVQNSIPWILVSSFGWAVGIIVGSVVGLSLYYMFQQYSLRFSSQLDINPNALILWPVILAGIITGVIAGAITGAVLVRLLHPATPADQIESEERIITF